MTTRAHSPYRALLYVHTMGRELELSEDEDSEEKVAALFDVFSDC